METNTFNQSSTLSPTELNEMKNSEDYIDNFLVLRLAAATVFIVEFVLSCVGNILILFVMFITESLQTKSHALLANLSVCEIIKSIGYFVLTLHMFLTSTHGIITALCLASLSATALAIMASQWTLILIAAERYIKIIHGLRYHSIVTSGRLRLLLLLLWTYVTMISSTVFFFNGFVHPPRPQTCDFNGVLRHPALRLISFNVVIPQILILLVYSVLFRVAIIQKRKIKQEESIFAITVQSNQRNTTFPILKMTCLLIGVQYVNWLPLVVVTVTRTSPFFIKRPFLHEQLKVLALALAFLTSVTTPIVYHHRDHKFKEAFKRFKHKYVCSPHDVSM